jgi:hypothetical protein
VECLKRLKGNRGARELLWASWKQNTPKNFPERIMISFQPENNIKRSQSWTNTSFTVSPSLSLSLSHHSPGEQRGLASKLQMGRQREVEIYPGPHS